ncbi:Translation initiation factor IF-3 protein [Haloplasma contractile SSD-17B]|uniref:Translation initiation factor IF-3 n=1 Tax=Haloplasma contractile SSD-17B TaxID=1033810 RepID=U2FPP3_9MOLU|nr:Translation initiation factor IF-3 protein [Haloplasma contractile SSD-17B]
MLIISKKFNNQKKDDALVNEAIRVREIRLIGEDGEQLGIIPTKDAQTTAREKQLDLVCVAPNAKPPVCRIMNYGKYRYEQQRRAREAKKNQKQVQVKEIRMTPKIEEHDFNTKLRNATKFLTKGDKVRVVVRFRGRMIAYKDQGEEVINKFVDGLKEHGEAENRPKMEGKQMFVVVAPIKQN